MINMRDVKIVTNSIKQQVYEVLKEAIFNGELKSGEQLIEQDLADRLQTSRSPVREAITKLEGDGLVVKIANHGTFVMRPTKQDILDIQEMRKMIELFAIEKIAASMSFDKREELLAKRKELEQSRDQMDSEAFLNVEEMVWMSLIDMVDNTYIFESYSKLYGMINNFKHSVVDKTANILPQSADERIALIDALLAGNTEEAARLTTLHMDHASQILCQAFGFSEE